MTKRVQGHDVVVVGASAGGVQAVGALLAKLPEDLPAAVLVVIHRAPDYPALLPDVLARRSTLPVQSALHGDKVQRGRVFVAPPDTHLLMRPGYLAVVHGPKENGHRPSVDALFRTAAATYGARVVGVLLTGYLDCGTAGLLSIKARGGLTVVQDPSDAAVAEMPNSAIKNVEIDRVAPLADIPEVLNELVHTRVAARPKKVSRALATMEGHLLGDHSEIVCPLCKGSMTSALVDDYMSFRCHTGHAFSLDSLAMEQAEEIESALWASLRALEEGQSLALRIAERSLGDVAQRFRDRATAHGRHREVLRRMLLGDDKLSAPDAHEHLAEEQPKAVAAGGTRGTKRRRGR